MADISIKGRSPLLKGGRVGFSRAGPVGNLPWVRGTSRPGVRKAPRGAEHKEAIKQEQGLKITRGTPIRKEYADLKRAHHTKQRIQKARIGREARGMVWKARKSIEANPFVKRAMSQSIHPKSWRRQTTKLLKRGKE